MTEQNTTLQEQPKRRGNPNFGRKPVQDSTPLVENPGNGQPQANQSSDVSAMLAIMQQMQEELAELRASRDALIQSVDRNIFQRALANTSGNEDKRLLVRLRLLNGEPLIAWSNMRTNEVRYYKGEEIVDQTTEVTFIDGRKEVMPYELVFNHVSKTDWLPVNGKKTAIDGKVMYIIEYEGKEVEVGEPFING